MRLFVASSIPEEVSQKIGEVLIPFKNKYPDFDWVNPKNYHITLFFLGEREDEKTRDIVEGIEQILFDIPSTIISAHKMKLFVNGPELIIYLEMYKNNQFDTINNRFNSAISDSDLSQSKKKKYIPHLTIAGCKLPSKQQYFHLKKKLENAKIDIEFTVKSINLYQSKLDSSQPAYEILHSFKLQ